MVCMNAQLIENRLQIELHKIVTRKKWRFLAHYYHKIVVLIQVLLCVYILAKFSIYLRQFWLSLNVNVWMC